MKAPTQRFSNRVENYVRYRPGYPPPLLSLLAAKCGLHAVSRVADVGSGTGILTRLLLQAGCRLAGMEPNREMRESGERWLADLPNFSSTHGTAELTGMPAASLDLITAGQAFHWFDQPLARRISAPAQTRRLGGARLE